eukprot:2566833-Pyramimonas_sp.AAC.1
MMGDTGETLQVNVVYRRWLLIWPSYFVGCEGLKMQRHVLLYNRAPASDIAQQCVTIDAIFGDCVNRDAIDERIDKPLGNFWGK